MCTYWFNHLCVIYCHRRAIILNIICTVFFLPFCLILSWVILQKSVLTVTEEKAHFLEESESAFLFFGYLEVIRRGVCVAACLFYNQSNSWMCVCVSSPVWQRVTRRPVAVTDLRPLLKCCNANFALLLNLYIKCVFRLYVGMYSHGKNY